MRGWPLFPDCPVALSVVRVRFAELLLDPHSMTGVHGHTQDAAIDALAIDAPRHVSWWPRPDVKLFNVMVHCLNEATRHAGHADILREQLDGRTGTTAEYEEAVDVAARDEYCAMVEQVAKAASR